MKVLIISGGTGSINLKTGLSQYIPLENMYTLVNAYDNGLSTGLVRKIFNGDILGPSDVRKQQFLDYKLYREDIKTEESEKIYEVLSKRVTFYDKPKQRIFDLIKDLPEELVNAVEVYFEQPLANKIRYIDFSLANIIYASLAYINNKSLQKAADIMAEYLNLPKNIILNSDESLFLGAYTENGYKIYDEGKIVEWSNPHNRIKDIFLMTKDGEEKYPSLSDRAKEIIEKVDLIVISPGTQFSSLIPTYKTKGFLEAIKDKTIYIVPNIKPDKDMHGYKIGEMIDIIDNYFKDKNKTYFLIKGINNDVNENIKQKSVVLNLNINDDKHPPEIGRNILLYYYRDKINNINTILMDYDDTILSRDPNKYKISKKVMDLINEIKSKYKYMKIGIVTGKNISEISENINADFYLCNYGCTKYNKNREFEENINVINNSFQDTLVAALKKVKFNFSKYENRDDAIISLRFLDKDYRNVLAEYLNVIFSQKNIPLIARKAGTATVDVMLKNTNKFESIKYHLKDIKLNDVLYIGDEKEGNDKEALENLNSILVNSPEDTYTILKLFL